MKAPVMKTIIPSLIIGTLLSMPLAARADNCPALMAEIDSILASVPGLDEETIVDEENITKVKALRAEGESLHQQGQHTASREVLGQALQLLQNEN